jgi:hypothetical protein
VLLAAAEVFVGVGGTGELVRVGVLVLGGAFVAVRVGVRV